MFHDTHLLRYCQRYVFYQISRVEGRQGYRLEVSDFAGIGECRALKNSNNAVGLKEAAGNIVSSEVSE